MQQLLPLLGRDLREDVIEHEADGCEWHKIAHESPDPAFFQRQSCEQRHDCHTVKEVGFAGAICANCTYNWNGQHALLCTNRLSALRCISCRLTYDIDVPTERLNNGLILVALETLDDHL